MPETDAVRRSSLRRDKLLSKMGTTSCANIVQIINYRFSLFSSDLHLCDAASKLVSLREDLESLKSEADLKLRPSAKRGEKVGLSIVKSTWAMSQFLALPLVPRSPSTRLTRITCGGPSVTWIRRSLCGATSGRCATSASRTRLSIRSRRMTTASGSSRRPRCRPRS